MCMGRMMINLFLASLNSAHSFLSSLFIPFLLFLLLLSLLLSLSLSPSPSPSFPPSLSLSLPSSLPFPFPPSLSSLPDHWNRKQAVIHQDSL